MAKFIQAQSSTQNGAVLLETFAEQVVGSGEIKSVHLQSTWKITFNWNICQHMSKQFDRSPY